MSTSTADRLLETARSPHHAQLDRAQPRAWRPFPAEVSDLLCVESAAGVGPWMHPGVAITLVRTRAIVRFESRRPIHVEGDTLFLVPPLHAYSVRALDAESSPTVTLLFGAQRKLEPALMNAQPAMITQAELVSPVAQLVAELKRPVRSVERAAEVTPLLERLFASGTSIEVARTSSTATSLRPARDYLRAHVSSPVSTSTIAEMSRLTECHCIRAFHLEFGLPPHAYHMRLRLAEASKLLASGQSVSTVAYDCGFADQSHLSRKFKEVYGVAPGAWASAARLSNPPVPRSVMRRERVLRRHR